MRVRKVLAFIVWFGAGCGSDPLSPREGCEQLAAVLCEQLYACYTPGEIAALMLPPSEAACVSSLEEAQGCAAQTSENACEGNATFHGDEAESCVDQIGGLSCGAVRDPDFDVSIAAPSCGRVCAVD
jgi:hypothetical protein